MEENYSKKTYKQLLKDNAFLQWRLFPTSETDNHWRKLLENDSKLAGEVTKADRYLKEKYFNISPLPLEDEALLLQRILATLQDESSQKRGFIPGWARFSIAASVAAVIILSSIRYFNREQHESVEKNIIVGKELISQDIQLISDNKSISFQENIAIEINANGMAQINTEDCANKKTAIDVHDLNTLIVPYGKRSTLTLSDGSKVWLNSGSVLEFPARFTGESREVRLASGEIYIEVAPDKKKPFYVHTSDFHVRVYGTRFNVSAYADSPQSVVLVEGSVGLQSVGGNEVKLMPNEQAVCSRDGTFETQEVDVAHFISWKNGYLMFEDAPMPEVLKQIERYYNLSFSYDKDVALKDLTCNGKIILSENLDNVMTTITLLTSTRYKKENNRIYITNDSD